MVILKVPTKILSVEHFKVLESTINRVLNTTVAAGAYAQILDGAPNYRSTHSRGTRYCHPETSDLAFQAWDRFRSQFSLHMLTFKPSVLQGYQDAPLDSREFVLHLLEVVVIACHDIGIYLFKIADGGLRPLEPVRDPALDNPRLLSVPPPVSLFAQGPYTNVDEYPEKAAECAGYWVEFEIFGGVIVFDRGETGSECRSAFINPGGRWMIAELSDEQMQSLLNFGQGKVDKEDPPFPWKGERWARHVDPYLSFEQNIFRDRYEQRPPDRVRRDVFMADKFPDIKESMEFLDNQGL